MGWGIRQLPREGFHRLAVPAWEALSLRLLNVTVYLGMESLCCSKAHEARNTLRVLDAQKVRILSHGTVHLWNFLLFLPGRKVMRKYPLHRTLAHLLVLHFIVHSILKGLSSSSVACRPECIVPALCSAPLPARSPPSACGLLLKIQQGFWPASSLKHEPERCISANMSPVSATPSSNTIDLAALKAHPNPQSLTPWMLHTLTVYKRN